MSQLHHQDAIPAEGLPLKSTITRNRLPRKKVISPSSKQMFISNNYNTAKCVYFNQKTESAEIFMDETWIVKQKLVDFKNYLHKRKSSFSSSNQTITPRHLDTANELEMKQKLELKIQLAKTKMNELKEGLKRQQKIKAEILSHSDTRRPFSRKSAHQ